MPVPLLLIKTLEDLGDDDFKKFNFCLTNGGFDGYQRIPRSHLQNPHRTETVTKMIQSYGEKGAVDITVKILKENQNNYEAKTLQEAYAAEERAATPSASSSALAPPAAPAPPAVPVPPAAPAAISANNGSVIIAPMVNGGTSGSWTININK